MAELLIVLAFFAWCVVGALIAALIEAKIKAHYARVDARDHQ